MPAISPYTQYVRSLIANLQQAFSNQVGRNSLTFDLDNSLPGEQFAVLTFESMSPSRERVGAKALGSKFIDLQFLAMVSVTIDCSAMSDSEADQEVETVALEEALNLDHAIPLMKLDMVNSYGLVYGIEIDGSIDRSVSQPIDRRGIRVITMTATVKVPVAISVDRDGAHLPPIINA